MYGFVITTAGESMLARAAAGETLVLDGASVGKGVVLSAADAKALTALIDPVAEATTSSPAVAGQQISITVEYRNDMNGGLETGFALSEFGITAHVGADPSGLLYYGSLGDAPQTVKPIDQGLDAHRFPVAIAVTGEVTVTMDYPAGGFVTWDELGDLDYDPAGSAAAVKEELEADLATRMQHIGNITKYDTVLAAASALTVDGTFFGDPSSSIYNAEDKPPNTTDVQYFVMLDGTTGRRVVLAVGYAATEEYRYFGTRDILNGAWLNEWRPLPTAAEVDKKAVKSYGVLTEKDLLAWAKKQDGSGAFNVNPAVTTEGVPTVAWYSGFFEKSADGAYKLTLTQADNGKTSINVTYAQEWIGWLELADVRKTMVVDTRTQVAVDMNQLTKPGAYRNLFDSGVAQAPYHTPFGEEIAGYDNATYYNIIVLGELNRLTQICTSVFTHNRGYWWRARHDSYWSPWFRIATITSEPSTAGARAISAGTTDLTAGASALATGQIHLVYG